MALDAAVATAAGGRRGPSAGTAGTVVMVFPDHPTKVRRCCPVECWCATAMCVPTFVRRSCCSGQQVHWRMCEEAASEQEGLRPYAQVGVQFDRVVPGGINLGGSCPEGCGFFCNAAQLAAESAPEKGPDADLLVISELFEFITTAAKAGPLIVFFKVSGTSIAGESCPCGRRLLQKCVCDVLADDRCVILFEKDSPPNQKS